MASCIRCDTCDQVLSPGAPYLSIERLGGIGIEVFGARVDFDVCSASCLAQLATAMEEVPC